MNIYLIKQKEKTNSAKRINQTTYQVNNRKPPVPKQGLYNKSVTTIENIKPLGISQNSLRSGDIHNLQGFIDKAYDTAEKDRAERKKRLQRMKERRDKGSHERTDSTNNKKEI